MKDVMPGIAACPPKAFAGHEMYFPALNAPTRQETPMFIRDDITEYRRATYAQNG